MAGLEKPSSGTLWANGEEVTGVAVQKRSVAMVYQAFINYPSFSVYDNIASPLKVAGLPKKEIDAKVREFADLLKLTPMLERLPNELSGGQQQRTALARALVKRRRPGFCSTNPSPTWITSYARNCATSCRRCSPIPAPPSFYATSETSRSIIAGRLYRNPERGPRGSVLARLRPFIVTRKTLESARVFSDPPVNIAAIEKRGDTAYLSSSISWNVPAKLAAMPDGKYRIGLRPHHLSPDGVGVEVDGEVQIAEISGSESIVRVIVEGNNWVSETHGIHSYEFGQSASFFL